MATARKPAAKRKPNSTRNHRSTAARNHSARRNSSVVVVTPAQARQALAANPHAARRRRRRNPAIKGLIVDAAWAWAGGIATNLAAGFVPIRLEGLAGIGLRFAVAYGIGFLGEKVFGPHAGNMMAIGGGAAAAGEAVNYAFGKIGAAGTGLLNPGAAPQQMPPLPPGAEAMAGYDSPNYMLTDGMHGGFEDIIADPNGMGEIYEYAN